MTRRPKNNHTFNSTNTLADAITAYIHTCNRLIVHVYTQTHRTEYTHISATAEVNDYRHRYSIQHGIHTYNCVKSIFSKVPYLRFYSTHPEWHLEVLPTPDFHASVVGANVIEILAVYREQTSSHCRRPVDNTAVWFITLSTHSQSLMLVLIRSHSSHTLHLVHFGRPL